MKNLILALLFLIAFLIITFASSCKKDIDQKGWIEREYLQNTEFYVTNTTQNIFLNKCYFDNGKIIVTEPHLDTYITTHEYYFPQVDTIVMIFNKSVIYKCSVDVQNNGRILSLKSVNGSCCNFVLKKI